MTKYVTPVSKLHWMFACEAGRGEVKYRDWDDKHYVIVGGPDTTEAFWKLANKEDSEFLIRIRVEDENDVPETDK